MAKYPSKHSTVKSLSLFFSNPSESDEMSVSDMYKIAGREMFAEKPNRIWLSNKLTDFRHHNLVTPVYASVNGRKKLDKVVLTSQGKVALEMLGGEEIISKGEPTTREEPLKIIAYRGDGVTFANVGKLVAQLRRKHPEYEITFNMRLK